MSLLDWTAAHAACGCDGGQECCERGYYYLHQRLYDFVSFHDFVMVNGYGLQFTDLG